AKFHNPQERHPDSECLQFRSFITGCALSGLHSQPLIITGRASIVLALRVGLAFAAAHFDPTGIVVSPGLIWIKPWSSSFARNVSRSSCSRRGSTSYSATSVSYAASMEALR